MVFDPGDVNISIDVRFNLIRRLHFDASAIQHLPQQDRPPGNLLDFLHDHLGKPPPGE